MPLKCEPLIEVYMWHMSTIEIPKSTTLNCEIGATENRFSRLKLDIWPIQKIDFNTKHTNVEDLLSIEEFSMQNGNFSPHTAISSVWFLKVYIQSGEKNLPFEWFDKCELNSSKLFVEISSVDYIDYIFTFYIYSCHDEYNFFSQKLSMDAMLRWLFIIVIVIVWNNDDVNFSLLMQWNVWQKFQDKRAQIVVTVGRVKNNNCTMCTPHK